MLTEIRSLPKKGVEWAISGCFGEGKRRSGEKKVRMRTFRCAERSDPGKNPDFRRFAFSKKFLKTEDKSGIL